MSEQPERTDDAMYRGAVRVFQHRRGYRFSFDAVLLAHEVARHRPRHGIEFGTGSGIVSLCLATMLPDYRGEAYEVQASLAQLARENVERNGLGDRIGVIESDVRSLNRVGGGPTTVFMNPPYFGAGEGTPSPNRERALARHQENGSLLDLLRVAKQVAAGGRVVFVYPGEREVAAVAALRGAGLTDIAARRVLPREGGPATFVVLHAGLSDNGTFRLLQPIVLHDASGAPTEAHLAIVDGLLPTGALE